MKNLDNFDINYVLKPFEQDDVKAGAAAECYCHVITPTTWTVYLGGLTIIIIVQEDSLEPQTV